MSKGVVNFQPDKKLLVKYQISALLIFLATIIITLSVFVPLFYYGDDSKSALIAIIVICSITVAGYLIVLILNPYYFRSIKYELSDKEMIVYRGIIQKIVKVVPLRAITNIAIVRGPLDRIIGIGRIQIHTAGYSTSQGPEERIDGLINYQEIYKELMNKIKPLQPMTPLASLEEEKDPEEINLAILKELQEIKDILKKE